MGNPAEETCCYPNNSMLSPSGPLSTIHLSPIVVASDRAKSRHPFEIVGELIGIPKQRWAFCLP